MKRLVGAERRCRRCPFYVPGGGCRDQAIKSGRCGDWIWYVRGGKQCRRRYAYPYDPRTPAQLRCRGYLSGASRKYSQLLTDEDQDVCIAKGAKVQSRRRLDQSGTLTGHQYWVHKQYPREKAKSNATKAETASQVAQPQNVTGSTSDTRRGLAGVSPDLRAKRAVKPSAKGYRKPGPLPPPIHDSSFIPIAVARTRKSCNPPQRPTTSQESDQIGQWTQDHEKGLSSSTTLAKRIMRGRGRPDQALGIPSCGFTMYRLPLGGIGLPNRPRRM